MRLHQTMYTPTHNTHVHTHLPHTCTHPLTPHMYTPTHTTHVHTHSHHTCTHPHTPHTCTHPLTRSATVQLMVFLFLVTLMNAAGSWSGVSSRHLQHSTTMTMKILYHHHLPPSLLPSTIPWWCSKAIDQLKHLSNSYQNLILLIKIQPLMTEHSHTVISQQPYMLQQKQVYHTVQLTIVSLLMWIV